MRQLLAVFVVVSCLQSCAKDIMDVTSPDGSISLGIFLTEDGVPGYTVDVDGNPFIGKSILGMACKDSTIVPNRRLPE